MTLFFTMKWYVFYWFLILTDLGRMKSTNMKTLKLAVILCPSTIGLVLISQDWCFKNWFWFTSFFQSLFSHINEIFISRGKETNLSNYNYILPLNAEYSFFKDIFIFHFNFTFYNFKTPLKNIFIKIYLKQKFINLFLIIDVIAFKKTIVLRAFIYET